MPSLRMVASGIASGAQHSWEIADLAAEGFDPRYTDRPRPASETSRPVCGCRSRACLARTRQCAGVGLSDLLVVFSALLKGWIDRVFTQGWAYEDDANGKLVKKLQHLQVHLLAIGGADQRTYARHGYFGAMKTQIDYGIFGYCGARVVTSELLLASDAGFPQIHLDTAKTIGERIFSTQP